MGDEFGDYGRRHSQFGITCIYIVGLDSLLITVNEVVKGSRQGKKQKHLVSAHSACSHADTFPLLSIILPSISI